MKQKNNEDVRDFLARFEGELLESEVRMDNAIKISTFTRGLKPQVQHDVAMVDNQTDFETFCGNVIRIQDAHRRINFLGKHSTLAVGNTAQTDRFPVEMDWEPTRANSARAAPPSGRRAKWVAHDEIEKRKASGLCIRCGASGHRINSCPVLPARRPQANVAVATARVEPVLEDEEVSGKE